MYNVKIKKILLVAVRIRVWVTNSVSRILVYQLVAREADLSLLFNTFMHTVVVQQQITTIELMEEQSKKQKKTKNKRIKISCMKWLNCNNDITQVGCFFKI